MKWQKARIIRQGNVPGSPPAGFEIWVQGPPFIPKEHQVSTAPGSTTKVAAYPGLRTNIINGEAKTPVPGCTLADDCAYVNPKVVELLDEFCDDPPMVNWGDW